MISATIALVLVWLIVAASIFTFYFNFINLRDAGDPVELEGGRFVPRSGWLEP